jgi:hypothetical protein
VEWLKNILKMPVEIIVDDGSLRAENNLECDNMTNRWLPKSFREEGDAIKYVQVFEDRIGFQPNLSILDLLFNVGPGASALLNNQ